MRRSIDAVGTPLVALAVLAGLAALVALVALVSGCSLADTSGLKPGELGNGGFYFSCDDAVACKPYSNDAAKFPKAVSLGSSFDVRFVPKSTSSNGTNIQFNESRPDRGITVGPVGEYVSRGPNGLVALKLGYGTLASRDASGQLIDYVVVRIARPDTLVIYSVDDTSSSPVDTVTLAPGGRQTFSAFAQEKKENLAGSLQIEWKSSNPAILDVESVNGVTATIVARSPGNAGLIATGGTFSQQVPVKVGP